MHNIDKNLANILSSYFSIDEIENVSRIEGGLTNYNYRIQLTGNILRFLKIYRYSNQSIAINEIGLIEHLLNHGYSTPSIIKTKSGNKLYRDTTNTVVMTEFIDGIYPNQTPENLFNIGVLIASLHCIEEPKYLKNGYALQFNDIISGLSKLTNNSRKYEEVIYFFNTTLNLVKEIPFAKLPKGLAHCDIFLDNMILTANHKVFLIDFEEAARENFLFDIARSIFGCCIINDLIDYSLVKCLIDGYLSKRQLTSIEKEYLYEYIIYCGILSTFWRFYEFNVKRPNEGKEHIYLKFIPSIENIMFYDKNDILSRITR